MVLRTMSMLTVLALLTACGGGGGGSSDGNTDPGGVNPPPTTWTPGVFLPYEQFAARCVAPRSGINPQTGRPYPDVPGTRLDENNWLRSWTNELYLWYSQVPDLNPANYETLEYFDLLKAPQDRFHFTYDTDEWNELSQSGVSVSYGLEWALLSREVPRNIVVAYTEPGSSAANAGVMRGDRVVAIDGVDINTTISAGITILNAGLSPRDEGETHTFTLRAPDSSTTRTVTLTAGKVTKVPVQSVKTIPTPTGTVGYLVFNDHIATSESALIDAFTFFKNNAVSDLILDLRYNSGGFLAIASETAYMIAGPLQTAGRAFETLKFNDKHPTTNPVTGEPLTPTPFYNTTSGAFSAPAGVSLPTLNLPRVFVITGSDTCSASESIMNSLRGVDVEVIQIGSTTCGKPYGFYAWDNCGTTYFSVQFQGVNDKGFGDYGNGFSPAHFGSVSNTSLPGCSVADDFTRQLGDVNELRLQTALYYRDNQSCPLPPSGFSKPFQAKQPESGMPGEPLLEKSLWLKNRIVQPSGQR